MGATAVRAVSGVELMRALLEVSSILDAVTSKPARKARDYLQKWLRSVAKLPPIAVSGAAAVFPPAEDLFARLKKKRKTEKSAADRVARIANKVFTILAGASGKAALDATLDAPAIKRAMDVLKGLASPSRGWEGVILLAIVLAALTWARRR